MPVDPQATIPSTSTCRRSRSRWSALAAAGRRDVSLQAVGGLITSDMALAAAVLKAVNSSLYGLSGRVQKRAAGHHLPGHARGRGSHLRDGPEGGIPRRSQAQAVCKRASVRGLLMGRIGRAIAVDPGRRIRPGCSRNAARRCCSATRRSATSRCCARRRGTTRTCCCSNTTNSASAMTRSAPRCARPGASRPRRGAQRCAST